jgi:hypothetical protein
LNTPVGQRQRLLLYAGQFRSGSPTAPGIGIQRRFTNLAGSVLFAPPSVTDFSPPTFGPVSVTAAGATVGFAVDVTDADGDSDVKRVFALYRDASGIWKTAEFSHIGSRWSGAGPVTGTSVEWFIQAIDAAGNVGVTSNKASVKSLTPPVPVGAISAALSGTGPVNGWYTSAVTVTITGAPGITYSLDGAPFASYGTPFAVTGTGVHVIAFQGSDGSSGSVTVPIDVTPPTVNSPPTPGTIEAGQTNASGIFTCADAGSGIASCTYTLDTSTITPGTTTRFVTVTATDRVGNTFTKPNIPYRVVYPFRGFLRPITNLPYLNIVNSGSAVPVKFSLSGNRGLGILASGSPSSLMINCDGTAPTDEIVTSTAGSSGLSYDAKSDTYTYVWKTDKAWAGTCRQLVVRFADGNAKLANFKFK